MYIFTRRAQLKFYRFAMFSYKARIGDRSSSSVTSDLLDLTQIRLSSIDRGRFCVLMKHRVLLAIQSELKLAKVLLLFSRDGAKSW